MTTQPPENFHIAKHPGSRENAIAIRKKGMLTYIFMPPLEKITGGMRVLAQVANQLAASGRECCFVVSGSFPSALENPDIPIRKLDKVSTGQQDRWLVPEGWPVALAPALAAGARCAIYVQNWAFLLGRLPNGVTWQSLPVRMLAVSEPVRTFIQETTGLDSKILPPALDHHFFLPSGAASSNMRIAWMPRKNRGMATQIRTIFEALATTRGKPLPEWIAIENLTLENVALTMQSCQIFLATGFPEGFGLPPLEAMACGCLVAGFGGMGGWDYMRQALPNGFQPAIKLAERPWGPNGFYAADGDVWGAALALMAAYDTLLENAPNLAAIRASALTAARWYDFARQKTAVARIWDDDNFWNCNG